MASRLTPQSSMRSTTPLAPRLSVFDRTEVRFTSPAIAAKHAAKKRQTKSTPQCKNSQCTNSEVKEEDGKIICISCGYVLDDVQITQELTFGEASNGAAVVQGTYVGAGESNARNSTQGASRITGGFDGRAMTERLGLQHIQSFITPLRLNTTHKDRAMSVFKLTIGHNFNQGRSLREVAAVCVYIGCRMDTECKVMLIDFADLLDINVFKLGHVYNDLVDRIGYRGDPGDDSASPSLFDVNPENLIQRFAQDLEFGKDEHRIANEAVQILKRLNRDWISPGRRPAGVCAAALILAARMNNYRRTVREVVYTAKVCDITIHKRLEEFKYTESSKLTVEEFRHHGLSLEKEHDPPSYYEQFTKSRKKRKVRHNIEQDDDMRDTEIGATDTTATETRAETRDAETIAQARRAAMPPPSEPIDPAILSGLGMDTESEGYLATLAAEAENQDGDTTPGQKRKRGKPKGSKNKPLPVLTEAAIRHQNAIETEVETILGVETALTSATETHNTLSTGEGYNVGTTDDGDLASLDNDIEVKNCLLTEVEASVKERIWVSVNGDYLREQQARKIKRELQDKSGTAPQAKTRVRRRGRMGDGSWKKNGEPTTPAEAVQGMLQNRGYSKKINYAAAEYLFAPLEKRKREREARERESRSESTGSKTATPGPSPLQGQSETGDGNLQTPQATEAQVTEPQAKDTGKDQSDPIHIEDGDDDDLVDDYVEPEAGQEEDEDDGKEYADEDEYGFDSEEGEEY